MPTPHDATRDATSRRTVVAGLAAGGLALPVLAACGSGSTSTPASTSGAAGGAGNGSGGASQTPDGPLTSTADIPVGGGKIFTKPAVVVTQPASGEFKAFSAICTHAGCAVTTISDGLIHCPCHGSEYSIKDGSVKGGPAPAPLASEKITIAGGEITLA